MTTRTVRRSPTLQKIPEVAPEFSFTQAEVELLAQRLAEPKWLIERRLDAWQTYRDLPMPTLRDEAWRRSDIRKLPMSRLALKPCEDVSLDSSLLASHRDGETAGQLILRPGLSSRQVGGEKLAELGVVMCDWDTAIHKHDSLLREHF